MTPPFGSDLGQIKGGVIRFSGYQIFWTPKIFACGGSILPYKSLQRESKRLNVRLRQLDIAYKRTPKSCFFPPAAGFPPLFPLSKAPQAKILQGILRLL